MTKWRGGSLVLTIGLMMAGCDNPVETPLTEDKPSFTMLPAWRDPDIRKAGKADDANTYRLTHPEMFAATAAPTRPFRALLEWEPSQILVLSYPSTDVGTAVSKSIAAIAANAIPYAKVQVLSKSASARTSLTNRIRAMGVSDEDIDARLSFLEWSADSIWTIDFGPVPIVDTEGTIAFADFIYYPERPYDDAIPYHHARELGITDYRGQIVFEGGNFQTDGQGRCYVTQGLYQENGITAEELDARLRDYLNCQTMVVLQPLKGEGTTHIDMFFKLVSPTRALLGRYAESDDLANAKILEDNLARLMAVDLGGGARLEVIRIPMPPHTPEAGSSEKVWRTYTNSTMVYPVNIWPVYSRWPELQAEAETAWKTALPDWTHVGVNSDEVITWGGAMHCVSRTIPAGLLEAWVADGICNDQGVCDPPEGGYDGDCADDSDCVGPAWLCECNDCSTGCVAVPDRCRGITYEGCCTDEGKLKYCEDNAIVTFDCGAANRCGWDSDYETYECGFSGEGPAAWPRACPLACGDVPEAGVCDGNTVKWCEAGALETRDCATDGLVCGPDPAEPAKAACVAPCEDACEEGVRTCTDDALGYLGCVRENNGCLGVVTVPCGEGTTCSNGACEPIMAEEVLPDDVLPVDVRAMGGGCHATPASTDGGLPLLSLLLGAWMLIGMRRKARHQI